MQRSGTIPEALRAGPEDLRWARGRGRRRASMPPLDRFLAFNAARRLGMRFEPRAPDRLATLLALTVVSPLPSGEGRPDAPETLLEFPAPSDGHLLLLDRIDARDSPDREPQIDRARVLLALGKQLEEPPLELEQARVQVLQLLA